MTWKRDEITKEGTNTTARYTNLVASRSKRLGSRSRITDRGQQPLNFGALGSVRRQPAQELLRLLCRLGPMVRPGVRNGEPEARLVQIGIERQRALQMANAGGRSSAVGLPPA